MDLKNQELQKYISLSIGLLGQFLGGSIFGFNAYAIALKQTFNYTQTELEYIASSGDLGLCFSFPAGIVFDYLGLRPTCVLSLILSGLGFGLMSAATHLKIFFVSKYWLLCIFYFMASAGTMFIITAGLVTNCKNFDSKQTGKVVGLLQAVFGISPAIFSALYEGLFVQGHTEDPENQNVGQFLLMLTVLSVCINAFGVVMLRIIPDKTPESTDTKMEEFNNTNESTKSLVKTGNINDKVNEKTDLIPQEAIDLPPGEEMKCWHIIRTPQFYCIVLICLITGGIGGTITNNITTVVKSAKLFTTSLSFTATIPIFASVGRLLGGVISDYVSQKWPAALKSTCLIFPITFVGISQILFAVFNQSFAGLIGASAITALGFGSLYVQVSLITIMFFGLKYYAQNNGLIVSGHAVGIYLFQQLFGFNYEIHSLSGSQSCYGELCTRWFFVLTSILSFSAVILNLCLLKIERDNNLQFQEQDCN